MQGVRGGEHEHEYEYEYGNRVAFLGVFAVVGCVVLEGGLAPSPPTPLPRCIGIYTSPEVKRRQEVCHLL